MSVIDITALKAKFESGDIPTGSDFVDLIDTLSSLPAALFEKEYFGRWQQSGGIGNPSLVVEFKNTLGISLSTNRVGVGDYYFYLTGLGATPVDITFQVQNVSAETASYANRVFSCGVPSSNLIHFECWDPTLNALDDGFLIDLWIKAFPTS